MYVMIELFIDDTLIANGIIKDFGGGGYLFLVLCGILFGQWVLNFQF
jgi:hypothetical protein